MRFRAAGRKGGAPAPAGARSGHLVRLRSVQFPPMSQTVAGPAVVLPLGERLRGGIGVGAVLLATVCWATAGVIAVKADTRGLPLTFWRVLMVAALFGVPMAIARRRLTWRVLKQAAPAGAVFGVTAAMFFESLHYTSVGIATIVAALTPVIAMPVAMRFLGERPTWLGVGCAVGAIGGVALFVAPGYRDASTSPRGLLLATGSMLAWVVYLFITKRARSGIGTLEYMTAMNLTAAAMLLPLLLLFDRDSLVPPREGWPWILLLALLPGFLGHGLLTWAQPLVDLSVSSVLLQGEPVGAALAGAIFLDEVIEPIQAAGMVLAVGALAVLARSSIKRVEEEQAYDPVGPVGDPPGAAPDLPRPPP
jgi:drug/metabolite transporter (DMT)-like permease